MMKPIVSLLMAGLLRSDLLFPLAVDHAPDHTRVVVASVVIHLAKEQIVICNLHIKVAWAIVAGCPSDGHLRICRDPIENSVSLATLDAGNYQLTHFVDHRWFGIDCQFFLLQPVHDFSNGSVVRARRWLLQFGDQRVQFLIGEFDCDHSCTSAASAAWFHSSYSSSSTGGLSYGRNFGSTPWMYV